MRKRTRESAGAAPDDNTLTPAPKMTRTVLDVLDVLTSGDDELYGLKIAQATGMKTGTVYPILTRLELAGWITSTWESPEELTDKGPRRKFYTLTPTGRQRAREALDARDEAQARARAKRTAFGLNG